VVLALGTFQFFIQVGLTGTLAGIAIAHGVLGVPYVFLTVRAALTKLDMALVRSAMSLGAGTWSVMRWVYLPALLPALVSGALLVFVVSFDEVVIALFLSGPGAITFPVKLFTDVQQNLSPAVMAVSTLLLAVVVLAVVVAVLVLGARRTIYRVALGDRADGVT
jgi:putative spermidine/putrescine transport system permease protein